MAGLFSYFGNSHPSFPGGHYDLTPPRGGGPYGGFPNFRYLDPVGPQTTYQLFRAQSGYFCLTSLGFNAPGLPGFHHYIRCNSSFLYQQTRRDTFSFLVASSNGSPYVATSSEHGSQSQAHPCCLNVGDCDPSLGNSDSGHFCHVQSTSPAFLSSNL